MLLVATVTGILLLISCLPDPTPELVPVPPQEPTALQWARVMPERITQADGTSVATIDKLEQDWLYDDICGIVQKMVHRCEGTVTYRLHLMPIDKTLWTFTSPNGRFGLYVGERAVFVWRKVVAFEYKKCREQEGMTSTTCPADVVPALTDDLDVLPVSDSARVDSIRASAVRLHH